MTVKSEMQNANALLSLYELLYKEAYGNKPLINRYKDKWGMLDAINDLGYDLARSTLEFYFKNKYHKHTLAEFYSSYDSLYGSMKEQAEEKERKQELMRETKKRVEEWNVSRSQGDQRTS